MVLPALPWTLPFIHMAIPMVLAADMAATSLQVSFDMSTSAAIAWLVEPTTATASAIGKKRFMVVRHQLIVLRRKLRGRVRLSKQRSLVPCPALSVVSDYSQSYDHPSRVAGALASGGLSPLSAVEVAPEAGRPRSETDLRALIRQMNIEIPLWGAPRIHGELLKLGFDVAQSCVARYMGKRRGPPSKDGGLLRNHAPRIAAMETLSVVPTIRSTGWMPSSSSGLISIDLVWINVTTNLTAEWIVS